MIEFDHQALQRKYNGCMAHLSIDGPRDIFGIVEDISQTTNSEGRLCTPRATIRVFPDNETIIVMIPTECERRKNEGYLQGFFVPWAIKPRLEVCYSRGGDAISLQSLPKFATAPLGVFVVSRLTQKSYFAGPLPGQNLRKKMICQTKVAVAVDQTGPGTFHLRSIEPEKIPDNEFPDFTQISGLLHVYKGTLYHGESAIGIEKSKKNFYIPNEVIRKLVSPEIETWKTRN